MSGGNPYCDTGTYAIQAVELASLPEGQARRTYVETFYRAKRIDMSGMPMNRGMIVYPSGGNRKDLSFWFKAKHTKVWKDAATQSFQASVSEYGVQFWAMISVASRLAQDIRSLHGIAVEAFTSSGTGPVDVDTELVSVTEQLLGAAALREIIGAKPSGGTREAQHAQMLWQRQLDELNCRVIEPAMNRIVALFTYRDRLSHAQTQAGLVHRISQSQGIDDQLDALVRRSGRDIEGSERIPSSSDEIPIAEFALRASLVEVRGYYLHDLLPLAIRP